MQRNEVKKIYKTRRLKDGKEVGRRINLLTQTLLAQYKLPQEKRDPKLVTEVATELKELRSEPRFRDEFPSFSKFFSFIKETNLGIYKKNKELPPEDHKPLITMADLREI